MIFTHCLRFYVALWLTWRCGLALKRRRSSKQEMPGSNPGSASLSSKQEIPGSNPGSASLSNHTLFIIMFTRFICQNDFHLLSANSRGAVA